MLDKLKELAKSRVAGSPKGITSICSAHPLVIRAALRHAALNRSPVLIEATCNQVNHQGGYTGMTPADFSSLVFTLAQQERCPDDLIILGGDHLGPNPWKTLPAEEALQEAEIMVRAFTEAGFRKLHLDASMGCKGEPVALDDKTVSVRAARLASVAEKAAQKGGPGPLYIIGTEVPPPGGADHELSELCPTDADAARETIRVHRDAFTRAGLENVLDRFCGVVVQPGVEYGNHNVIAYQREKARALCAILSDEPALVFEAHSTDYQEGSALAALVQDGFAILKVGPELTFALREAYFALDMIASELIPGYPERGLYRSVEKHMREHPENWKGYYEGDEHQQHILRHYSFSDRIRYYWSDDKVQEYVRILFSSLKGVSVPPSLIMQYLPGAEMFSNKPFNPEDVVIWKVEKIIQKYNNACYSN